MQPTKRNNELHIFNGRVIFRSSKSASGPPSERTILELNPQRLAKILEVTGWSTLEPGTLNLDVEKSSFDMLLEQAPLFVERGETVTYPEPYKHIPNVRKAYYYYNGSVRACDRTAAVLVRRAQIPGPIRVELYAPMSLKALFGVREGDILEISVGGSILAS